MYLLADNNTLFALGTVVTYIFLNYSNQVDWATEALIAYPFLVFFMVGNFRVSLIYCEWGRLRVIINKLIKLYGSTFFLVYGVIKV